MNKFIPNLKPLEYPQGEIIRIGGEGSADFRFPGNNFVRLLPYLVPNSGCPKEEQLGTSMLINEYLVSLMLQKRNYNGVINPKGIFEVAIPGRIVGLEETLIGPAFVREWKDGVVYTDLSQRKEVSDWPDEAEEQIAAIAQKAVEDGFTHYWGDEPLSWSVNYLWNSEERKVYHYNLSLWMGNEDEKEKLNSELGFL